MTVRQQRHCCIVGLGYTGLTLATEFGRADYETTGYDIDGRKIRAFSNGRDPTDTVGDDAIADTDVTYTDSPDRIDEAAYVFLCLPTPVDASGTPDLSGLEAACETVGEHIAPGAVVVVESTVYPGATREVLEPAVERGARTQGGVPFGIGYSPERIVPGGEKRFSETTKLVSAANESTLAALVDLYDDVVDAGVYPVDSIEAAEASKCLENVQRDVNIALVNEFAMGCRHLDIDPYTVLAAARTKWNFHDYTPGIVGGHCIPVDPHHLRHQFERNGYTPQLLRTARTVNEEFVSHVQSITVSALCEARAVEPALPAGGGTVADIRTEGSLPESVADSRVRLLGFTYKPNVSDARNSGVRRIAEGLAALDLRVSGYDPFYGHDDTSESFDFEVLPRLDFESVDAVVLLTAHDEFLDLGLTAVADRMNDSPILIDVPAAFDPAEAARAGFTYRRI